jgi:hypothetical protein
VGGAAGARAAGCCARQELPGPQHHEDLLVQAQVALVSRGLCVLLFVASGVCALAGRSSAKERGGLHRRAGAAL